MSAKSNIEGRIIQLMCERRACGLYSATVDDLAKTLHLSRTNVHAAVNGLIKSRKLEYSTKNGLSSQARYRMAGGS